MIVLLQGFLLLLALIGALGYMAVKAARRDWMYVGEGMGVDEFPDLNERWSCGSGTTKVVAVRLSGFIGLAEEQGLWSKDPSSAALALRCIKRATHDKDVKALILVIDSGGGGITASDIIYGHVQKFKDEQPGRCVVALLGDVAASGAYYVSAAADIILAHPTTLTGSIGVLIQTVNAKGLADKIGLKDITFRSGPNKDMLNPLTDMTEEQCALLQSVVNDLHDRFVMIVAEARGIDEEEVRGFADGRVFLASKAVELGLVDEIGYWDDAVAAVEEMLGVEDIKVYRYEEGFSLSSLLRASAEGHRMSIMDELRTRTRILYQWDIFL